MKRRIEIALGNNVPNLGRNEPCKQGWRKYKIAPADSDMFIYRQIYVIPLVYH